MYNPTQLATNGERPPGIKVTVECGEVNHAFSDVPMAKKKVIECSSEGNWTDTGECLKS